MQHFLEGAMMYPLPGHASYTKKGHVLWLETNVFVYFKYMRCFLYRMQDLHPLSAEH